MATFTPAGSGGAPLGSVGISGATVPVIANVAAPTAGTEYSYVIPPNTKQFRIQSRLSAKLRLSVTAGATATVYYTVWPGAVYQEDVLSTMSVVLYFTSTKASDIIEITSWT